MTLAHASQFSSYRDFVSHLSVDYPEFAWLRDFLAKPGATPSVTRVVVIDSTKDGRLNTPELDGTLPTLSQTLNHYPANVQTRIIHVSYIQSWSIDRDLIDALGMRFDIDPLFFWGHLDHYWASKDRLCPRGSRDVQRLWIQPLPSERLFLDIRCISVAFSAIFLGDSDESPKTSKLLCSPNTSIRHI